MQRQHGHGDVFDHAVDETRLDHPHDRQIGRQIRQVQLVDAGADGKEHFKVREQAPQIVGRNPGREIADIGGIADIRPDPERQLRRLHRQQPCPFARALGIGFEKQGHRQPPAMLSRAPD